MSYNITHVDTPVLDAWMLPADVVRLHKQFQGELPEVNFLDGMLKAANAALAAGEVAKTIPLVNFWWSGEGSGYSLDTLNEIAASVHGRVDAVLTWERGDSMTGLRIVDGVVRVRRAHGARAEKGQVSELDVTPESLRAHAKELRAVAASESGHRRKHLLQDAGELVAAADLIERLTISQQRRNDDAVELGRLRAQVAELERSGDALALENVVLAAKCRMIADIPRTEERATAGAIQQEMIRDAHAEIDALRANLTAAERVIESVTLESVECTLDHDALNMACPKRLAREYIAARAKTAKPAEPHISGAEFVDAARALLPDAFSELDAPLSDSEEVPRG